MPLFLLFILIPIVEIALFIQIGGLIGMLPTIALVLLSAVVGTFLIRSQGLRTLAELQSSFRTMSNPTRPLAHGAMIMFAGALLLTPGFFTDTVGLLLLVPQVRDWVMRKAGRQVRRASFGFDPAAQPRHGWGGRGPARGDDIIDGEYEVQDDPYPLRDDIEPDRPTPAPRNSARRPPSGWTRPD